MRMFKPNHQQGVTGLVQSGIRNVDTSAVAYSKLTRYLAPDFILLDEDTKPNLGLSAGALSVGLGLAGFMAYRLVKESGPETYEIS